MFLVLEYFWFSLLIFYSSSIGRRNFFYLTFPIFTHLHLQLNFLLSSNVFELLSIYSCTIYISTLDYEFGGHFVVAFSVLES